jgi:AcrR family transcriptional regulator
MGNTDATKSGVRSISNPVRPARLRTGGRSERVRLAVAQAVLALVREVGPADFNVAEVAQRAGVHRTTIYRWWPTRADLVREALTVHTARLVLPDTGQWKNDVLALAVELADFFSDPVEMAMNAALSAGSNTELDVLQIQHWVPIFEEFSQIVERAKRRGEIRSDTDPVVVLNLLTGPLLTHTVILHSRPDANLIRQMAAAVAQAFVDP